MTHSLLDGILIECGVHEYRCRIVDANVNRILLREVAQAVMVPMTLVSRSGVRDVGKELPRVRPGLSMLFLGRAGPKHNWKPSQHAYVRDTSGTAVVPTCSPHKWEIT